MSEKRAAWSLNKYLVQLGCLAASLLYLSLTQRIGWHFLLSMTQAGLEVLVFKVALVWRPAVDTNPIVDSSRVLPYIE